MSFGQNFADAMNSVQVMTEGLINNGRVDLMSAMPTFDIPNFQAAHTRPMQNNRVAAEAISSQISMNPVSKLFFSEMNLNGLHDAIRYTVYVQSEGRFTIGRQSDQELRIIMRSIYLQYSMNNQTDCVGQVRVLNAKVLDYVVPEVLSNLLQYERYKVDASTLPMPMERGQLLTTKGTKELELKNFF